MDGGTKYTMAHHHQHHESPSAATYEFKDTTVSIKTGGRKGGHHHHRRVSSSGQSVEDVDPTDGTGSLTYSATSSVQSGASAGESTDSSFADIMRVLELQDGTELAALMKKEGITSAAELRDKQRNAAATAAANSAAASGVSVASSLNYSTDGESALDSALEGSHLLQTITGQPSDSYAFDGGGMGNNNSTGQEKPRLQTPTRTHPDDVAFSGGNNILFAPADPADVKRKKKDKRSKATLTDTPRAKNGSHRKSYDEDDANSKQPSTPRKASPSPTTVTSKSVVPSTPPPSSSRPPPRSSSGVTSSSPSSKKRSSTTAEEEEDVWYAKWWMSCFPDAFRDLVPKR